MNKLPLYFNCHFFKGPGGLLRHTYKIDASGVQVHPYQLFRLDDDKWENLSVYATISDAVRTLLKELPSAKLADEIKHGQAVINPAEILQRIEQGERTVSIGGPRNEKFRIEFDIDFDDLVERI